VNLRQGLWIVCCLGTVDPLELAARCSRDDTPYMFPVILEGLNRLMYCIDRCGVSRESVECERRASARLLSKRGMNWLLVEQIEIAAGDENSGETGEEGEAKKGRARLKVCSGRFYAAVART